MEIDESRVAGTHPEPGDSGAAEEVSDRMPRDSDLDASRLLQRSESEAFGRLPQELRQSRHNLVPERHLHPTRPIGGDALVAWIDGTIRACGISMAETRPGPTE